jgi:hypothetical protein
VIKTFITLIVVWGGLVVIQGCNDKKPNGPDMRNPTLYFPLNFEYKWTYVKLNTQCEVSEDSFSVSVSNKNTRLIQGIGWESGWDLVSATGGTTFVYHKSDSIFTLDIGSTLFPAKVLVGPIQAGTSWKDSRGYEYYIGGFEDVYSEAAGGVYRGCARIRRTISGDTKKSDFWWAPQIGKIKRKEINLSGQCVSGEELRRLDKSPNFP